MKTGIVVQARMGSTRLPGKVCREFYAGQSILDILLKRLLKNRLNLQVVLATSISENDDPIVAAGKKLGIDVYRGSEQNVLERFVEAAQHFMLEGVIRVCADNPFLDLPSLEFLATSLEQYPTADYHSFTLDGITPTILSHIGVFAEATRLRVLERVLQETTEALYHEHVTNYIHQQAEIFHLKLHPVPDFLYQRTDIRLTVDTLEDFQMHQKLYASCLTNGVLLPLKDIIEVIDRQPELLRSMQIEIKKNAK